MWRAQSDARLFGATVVGLAVVAWLTLGALHMGGSASQFSHEALGHADLDVAGSLALVAALFAAGWLLMTTAMMLPTALPLVILFGTITERRQNRGGLLLALIAGYIGVWLLVGLAAFGFDYAVHRVVETSAWLHANTWLLVTLPLITAGIYQFTPLKYMCLDKCRSPYSFIVAHWRGRRPALDALRIGISHGVFCVGCCWSLMLMMLAMSTGAFIWMIVLAVVMGVEKNLPRGRRIAQPVGVVLLSAGLTIVAMNIA